MSLTATFSKPGAVPAGSTSATRGRFRNDGEPHVREWRRIFPLAYFTHGGDATVRHLSTGGLRTLSMSQYESFPHVLELLNHPDCGYKAVGIDCLIYSGGNPASHEGVEHVAQNIADDFPDGRMKIVPGATGNFSAAMPSANTNYWPDSVAASPELAAQFADALMDTYGSIPSVLSWNLKDDCSDQADYCRFDKAGYLIDAIQAADDYDRWPFVVLGGSTITPIPQLSYNYSHPCEPGNPEGDFHRSSFASLPDIGGGGGDFVDAIRRLRTSPRPWFWYQVQCHQTGDGGLRYPTGPEIGMQAAILAGEGAKGIGFFCLTDGTTVTENWLGLSHPDSILRLAAVKEFCHRFNLGIRERYRNSAPADDQFLTSGGGSGSTYASGHNYANAYKATLYDASTDTYYLTVVNHSSSAANITVTGTDLISTGSIVDLNTHAVTQLGSSVNLPGFGYAFYVYQP